MKEDIEVILRAFKESHTELQNSFAISLEATKAEFNDGNQKTIQAVQRKLSSLSEKKWKREGNKRQFEFNQSIDDLVSEAIDDPTNAGTHLKKAKYTIVGRQKLI